MSWFSSKKPEQKDALTVATEKSKMAVDFITVAVNDLKDANEQFINVQNELAEQITQLRLASDRAATQKMNNDRVINKLNDIIA